MTEVKFLNGLDGNPYTDVNPEPRGTVASCRARKRRCSWSAVSNSFASEGWQHPLVTEQRSEVQNHGEGYRGKTEGGLCRSSLLTRPPPPPPLSSVGHALPHTYLNFNFGFTSL